MGLNAAKAQPRRSAPGDCAPVLLMPEILERTFAST
jgi:hypothetical protein